MWFTAETSEVLEIKNITSAKTYSSPDELSLGDSLPSPPKSVRTDGVRLRHNQIFTDG